MSASSRNLFIICLILISAAKPILAASQDNQHADPNLLQNERYGPIRPHDTLWSIAKLFVKKGESVYTVLNELQQANPKSIKTGNLVLAGGYIQRHAGIDAQDKPKFRPQLSAEFHTVEAQLIGQIPESSSQDPIRYIPETSSLPAPEIHAEQQSSSSVILYLLMALIVLVPASFWGLRHTQLQRQQQIIEQDKQDKLNALKRESIKNRLKSSSDETSN